MSSASGAMLWTFQAFPTVQRTALGMPLWLAKILSPEVGVISDNKKVYGAISWLMFEHTTDLYFSSTCDLVQEVKSQIAASVRPQRSTNFHQLLDPSAAEEHVVPSVNDLADESFSICTAATDTSGNTMTIVAYNVVANPVIYEKPGVKVEGGFPE